MSLKADIYIGVRNFRNYRNGFLSLRGFIGAVLSIGLSMVPIIVVLEVSSGMIEGITRRYVEVSSFHLQAGTYGDMSETNDISVLDELKKVHGVESVVPFIDGQGLIYSGTGRTGVQVRGVQPALYHDDPGFQENLTILDGDFSFGEDGRGLLLSSTIAEDLDIKVGDAVKLLISRTSARGGRPILKPGNYHLTGIFTTGYHELDKFSIYMDFDRAGQVFGQKGTLGIGIKTVNYTDSLGGIKGDIQRILSDSWYIIPWYDQERSLYRNLETTRTMLLFIMGIIIVVAAVNISASMLNLVMEKQEQIAILKSLGASPHNIRLQFLSTGFFTGITGVFLGMSLGLLLSVNINSGISLIESILNWAVYLGKSLLDPLGGVVKPAITILNPEYYLEDIPLKLPLIETMIIGGFTLISAILASWFPARKASEILPLEVLRHHG
ncbi:MAG: ABC transporter permease [Spirochaetales bacterium]|nr:ABC transporter permease [Spirochaetales bacterium]